MQRIDRPYVICHMIPSVDGRIVMDGWRLPGPAEDQYDAVAALHRADAWLVGRISMEPFAGGKRGPVRGAVPPGDFVAPHKARSFAVALDPSGRLAFRRGDIDGEHVIAIITGRAPRAHLAHLRAKGVSYIIGGRTAVDLPAALRKLRSLFGIRRVLLEGGGRINGSLLDAGLIDELSVLVAPVADGRPGRPSLFDAAGGKGPGAGLKLLSHRTRPGGVVWLRYKVLPRARRPR